MNLESQLLVSNYLYGLGDGFRFSLASKPTRFVSTLSKEDVPSWLGTLKIGKDNLTVLLQIDDWDFNTLPSLYIKMPLPSHWQKLLPSLI